MAYLVNLGWLLLALLCVWGLVAGALWLMVVERPGRDQRDWEADE